MNRRASDPLMRQVISYTPNKAMEFAANRPPG
jgi:hypothetical protein